MKPLIVANWKMNPQSLDEVRRLFNSIKKGIKKIKNLEMVICPPFPYLLVIKLYSHKAIKLGAQDCFWEEKGAFTGEVSAVILKNIGCQYVIIGHSERRRYFQETDEIVNKKIRAALKIKLNPIFCIGETQTERDKGQTQAVLKKQLTLGLKDISKSQIEDVKFFIAYEPVWAIGTGNPCSVEEAMSAAIMIRKIITSLFSFSISKKIRIIYGGSINRKNSANYIKEAKMDGLLVGGASLEAKELISIIKSVS